MFCGFCGTQNEENAVFCTGCGAKLNGGESGSVASPVETKPKGKNNHVVKIAITVVAVIVVLAALIFVGRSLTSRGPEATVKQYLDAYIKSDVNKMFKLFPEDLIEYAMDEEGYDKDDLNDFKDDLEDQLQNNHDRMEEYYGDDCSLSYKIVDVEDITGDDLDDKKDTYKECDVKVSAAKRVEVKLTIKSEDDKESEKIYIPVIKVGRSWYLDIFNMGGLF